MFIQKFSAAPFLLSLVALATACGNPKEEEEKTPTNQWAGQTYLLDIQSANWSQPRGIGIEIDDFVPNFLIRIDGTAPDHFSVMLGTATADGVQDPCNPTSTAEATSENPSVTIGPTEFPMHIQHVTKPVAVDGIAYGMTITNILPNGNTLAQDGTFTATMDFREVYRLFTLLPVPTPEAVCTTFNDNYDRPCEPCPTDQEPFCLTLEAVDLGATRTDAGIEPVDPSDVDPVACTPMPE